MARTLPKREQQPGFALFHQSSSATSGVEKQPRPPWLISGPAKTLSQDQSGHCLDALLHLATSLPARTAAETWLEPGHNTRAPDTYLGEEKQGCCFSQEHVLGCNGIHFQSMETLPPSSFQREGRKSLSWLPQYCSTIEAFGKVPC